MNYPVVQIPRENVLYDEQMWVERTNPRNPLDSRILLRIAGCWPEGYEAMMPEDFRDLSPVVTV